MITGATACTSRGADVAEAPLGQHAFRILFELGADFGVSQQTENELDQCVGNCSERKTHARLLTV